MTTTTFDDGEYDRILSGFAGKPRTGKSGRLRRFWREANTLGRMAKAWRRGEYELTTPQVAMLFGALAYVVVPTDAVPDVIFGAGYLDDAAVVAGVVTALAFEIASFREWEARQGRK